MNLCMGYVGGRTDYGAGQSWRGANRTTARDSPDYGMRYR